MATSPDEPVENGTEQGASTEVATRYGQPAGAIESMQGSAIIVRSDGAEEDLSLGDFVYPEDEIFTDEASALSVRFTDQTSFSIGEDSALVIDEYVYDPKTGDGAVDVSVVKGMFVFVSGLVADKNHDAMSIKTPSATIGIRGTEGMGKIGESEAESYFVNADGVITISTPTGTVVIDQINETVVVLDSTSAPQMTTSWTSEQVIQTFVSALSVAPFSVTQRVVNADPSLGGDARSILNKAIKTMKAVQAAEKAGEGDGDGESEDGGRGDGKASDEEGEGEEGEEEEGEEEEGEEEEGEEGEEEEGEEEEGEEEEGEEEEAAEEEAAEEEAAEEEVAEEEAAEEEAAEEEAAEEEAAEEEAAEEEAAEEEAAEEEAATEEEAAAEEAPAEEAPAAEDAPTEDAPAAEEPAAESSPEPAVEAAPEPAAESAPEPASAPEAAPAPAEPEPILPPEPPIIVNNAPVAVLDDSQLSEQAVLTVTVANGVLSNDTDLDADDLTVVSIAADGQDASGGVGAEVTGAFGALLIFADGSYSYTANDETNTLAEGETLTDTFTYTVRDDDGATSAARLVIVVNGENDAPTAESESFTMSEDGILVGQLTFDDVDASDVDQLTVNTTPASGPSNGNLVLLADGTFVYTPDADFNGSDSFEYEVTDGNGGAVVATVDISIESVADDFAADGRAVDGYIANATVFFDANNNGNLDEGELSAVTDDQGNYSLTLPEGASGSIIVLAGGIDIATGETVDVNLSAPVDVALASAGTLVISPLSSLVDSLIKSGQTQAEALATAAQITGTADRQNLLTADPVALSLAGDADGIAILQANVAIHSLVALGSSALAGASGGAVSVADASAAMFAAVAANIGNLLEGTSVDFATTISEAAASLGVTISESDAAALGQLLQTVVDSTDVANNPSLNASEQLVRLVQISDLVQNELATDLQQSFEAGSFQQDFVVELENGTINPRIAGVTADDLGVIDPDNPEAPITIDNTGLNTAPVATVDAFSVDEDDSLTANVIANDIDIDGDTLTVSLVGNAASGSLSLSSDGTFTYLPNADFNGSDSFTYELSDGGSITDIATVNIDVNPVNDAPVAVADNFSVNEDGSLVDTVLSNDSDIDGDELSVSLSSGVSSGSLSLNGDGTFTYGPNEDFNGSDSFTYELSDGGLITSTATVNITVNPVNDAPTAVGESFGVAEDGSLFSTVLNNDFDLDGDSLTLNTVPVSGPFNGSLSLNANGFFTYTPNEDFNGTDSFDYEVTDGNGGSATATVNIAVNSVNDAPVANGDSYSVDEDGSLSTIVGFDDLLQNDTDIDFDSLSVTTEPLSGPFFGSLSLNSDGTFTYTPFEDFNGTDSFDYQVTDGNGGSATATVNITVNPVNDAPEAVDDFFNVDEDGSVTATLGFDDLLQNDTDINFDILTVTTTPVSAPSNGSLSLNSDGTFTYTPNEDFNGTDSFDYEVTDGNGGSAIATATVFVNPINDAPVANGDSYSVDEDGSLSTTVGFDDLLLNDTDIDFDSLSVTTEPLSGPFFGSLSLNDDGTFTYTPFEDFNGTDSFDYQVTDGNGGSATATVNITVNPVNDAPTAVGESFGVAEDGSLFSTVLNNDFDLDGDSLTLNTVPVSGPFNGSLSLNANGFFTYTPNEDFNGTDSFDYEVTDGNGGSATATVNIAVNPVNDAPVAADDFFSVDEDNSLNDTVLGNDVDIDGDELSVSLSSSTSSGSLSLNGDGTFTYTPFEDFNGSDSFSYELSDGGSVTSTATVNITVNPVNDAPVAADDFFNVDEDSSVTATLGFDDLLQNDTDIDFDTLTVTTTPVSTPSNGSLSLNSDGTFTYTPNEDFNGTDSFDYEVTDGNGGSAIATATVFVNPINDAPVANGDSYSVDEDGSLSTTVGFDDLLLNDTDIDFDRLSVTTEPLSGPFFGSLSLNNDGTFTYTPFEDFNGTDSFDYQVTDGNGGSATATVNITVNPVNDAPVANGDSYSVDEDGSLSTTVGFDDLLLNDTDIDFDSLSVTTEPLNGPFFGSLSLNNDGTFTYTPFEDFNGTDSFDYEVTDGNGGSATATVNIAVNPVNDAPVAADDFFNVDEDSSVTATLGFDDLLQNDTDIDFDTLTVTTTPVSTPSNGSLSLNSDGTFTYTPNEDFNGTDSFDYEVTDGNGGSAIATATVFVNPINDAPVANGDSYSVDEDGSLSTTVGFDDLLLNDTDIDFDRLSVTTEPLSGPFFGSLSLNNDGTFTYTPFEDFNGTDSFDYQVTDGNGGSATATVNITVNPVNDAPVAVDGQVFFDFEDTDVNDSLSNNDVDFDPLTTVLTPGGEPAFGSVVVNEDGTFTYTPDADFNGTDSFDYEVSDGNLTDTVTVNIVIDPVNDVPVVGNTLSASTDQNQAPVNLNLLTFASDVEGDNLGVRDVVVTSSNGARTVVFGLNSNGVLNIDPNQFADLGQGENEIVSVTYNVIEADRAFIASTGVETISSLGTYYVVDLDTNTIHAIGNDGAEIVSSLDALLSVGASRAAVLYLDGKAVNWNASVSYFVDGVETIIDPNAFVVSGYGGTITVGPLFVFYNQFATDATLDVSFTVVDAVQGDSTVSFTVNDIDFVDNGTGEIDIGGVSVEVAPELIPTTATLVVNGTNDAPSAINDSYTISEDGSITTTQGVNDILFNDRDDGGFSIVTTDLSVSDSVSDGDLNLNTNGTFTYTPDKDFNGSDSFTYQIIDSFGEISSAVVTINVTPVNDLPAVLNDAFTINEDEPLTTVLGVNDLLLNDDDVDGDTLSIVLPNLVVDPTNGTLALNANGTFTYTPNANFNGTDSFIYNVSDGNGGITIAAAAITITAVNDAPILDIAAVNSITAPDDGGGNPEVVSLFEFNGAANAIFDAELNAIDDYTGASITITLPDADGTVAFFDDGNPFGASELSVENNGTFIKEDGLTIAFITTTGNESTIDFVSGGGRFTSQDDANEIVALLEFSIDGSIPSTVAAISFDDGVIGGDASSDFTSNITIINGAFGGA